MTSDCILAAAGLTRGFGAGTTAVAAVRDAALHARAGELVAILGPSGSAKSTLLCLLGGLLAPDGGWVEIAGHRLCEMSAGALAEMRRRHIGFVFQKFNLLKALTARENVEVSLCLAGHSRSETRRLALLALDAVGLAHCAGRLPRDLSGGEQQRVAVARALSSKPPLVLADEPTGNLDSASGSGVVDLLHDHARSGQAAVVMVTHDPRAGREADRRLWMEDGVLQGDTDASDNHPGLAGR